MSDTSPSSSLTAFIARQRELLASERLADLNRSKLLLTNCPPRVLEQKGLALLGLGIVNVSIGLGGKTLIELDRPSAYHTSPVFPPHTLRTGDLASIEPHTATATTSVKDSKGIEGVIYKLSDTRVIVAVDNGNEVPDLPERCRVVKIANTVTYDRMDKAIDQLERILVGSGEISEHLTPLLRVLLGLQRPSEIDNSTVEDVQFFDSTLNSSQKEAVKFCLAAKEVACIHGPPGTGKTHTLIEIIRQLACSPPQSAPSGHNSTNRILVAGASNLSVDNILERLLPHENLTCTRIGHPARVLTSSEKNGTALLETTLDARAARSEQAELVKDVKKELEGLLSLLSSGGSKKKVGGGKSGSGGRDKGTTKPRGAERKRMWEEVKALRKEYRQRESQVTRTILSPSTSQIVFATCHSAGSRQLEKEEFDVVIVDEATQALEAVTFIPIFQAGFKRHTKLILAGDPMQLPPTVLAVELQQKKKKKKEVTSKKTEKGCSEVEKENEPDEDGSESEGSASEDEERKKLQNAATKVTGKDKKKLGTGVLCPPRTLETTLFDRLEEMWGEGIKRMLNVQYRMHHQICTFPSLALYSNKLISDSSVASHLLSDLPEVAKEEDLSTPVVFYDTAGCEYYEKVEGVGSSDTSSNKKNGGMKIDPEEGGSRWNENEALVVKSWVENLLRNGIKTSQIAIITPYQAQVAHISSLLHPTHPEIEIGSVDGMQGREKEAVVISLVRSNPNREVGFLKEKRRLNVAMTRAKRNLCVVGDSSTISYGGKYLRKWMKWLEDNADVRYAGLDGLE
ncbi:dna helicase [Moniliophthora roreri MCA 2997]|uniref:DNA helicase n=1 Tax=Moniliophthora roreri (strain MCA 2997) TaxID=1381753 RepID=V2XW65_MONRO|nr:dna helicase [Moniliophthora roreri MCA 2997]